MEDTKKELKTLKMSKLSLFYRTKSINNIEQNLLELDKNLKILKNNVEWKLQKLSKESKANINEIFCFYVVDINSIIYFSSKQITNQTIFIIRINSVFSTFQEFYFSVIQNKNQNFNILKINSLFDYKVNIIAYDSDFLLLSNKENRKILFCINCELCKKICPISNNLIPNYYPIKIIENDISQLNQKHNLCTNCRKCDNICPININISDFYILNKELSFNDKIKLYKLHKILKNMKIK